MAKARYREPIHFWIAVTVELVLAAAIVIAVTTIAAHAGVVHCRERGDPQGADRGFGLQ
jgi:hypothetical protein